MTHEPDAEQKTPEERREYHWNLVAAVILSLATLASAWCGFQASSWNGVFSTENRAANSARLESGRLSDIADRQLSSDLLIFATWLEAEVKADERMAAEVALRFQPHFRPAFDAWLALPVEADSRLPAGTPFERPEYVLPTHAAAQEAGARAAAAVSAADQAGTYNSRYVLATVLFASVLFLAGIAAKLSHAGLAHGVVVLAGFALAGALSMLATLPVQLSIG